MSWRSFSDSDWLGYTASQWLGFMALPSSLSHIVEAGTVYLAGGQGIIFIPGNGAGRIVS